MRNRSSRQATIGGFTLIELLVVISIIALLIAILLPSLHKAKDLSKTLDCKTRLRSWGIAMEMYQSDNDQFYAPVMDRRISPYKYWYDFVSYYMTSSDGGYFRGRGSFDRHLMIRCPVVSPYSPSPTSVMKLDSDFLYNAALAPRYWPTGALFATPIAGRTSEVADLSNTLILIDGRAEFEDTIREIGKTDPYSSNTMTDFRHNGATDTNVLFGDGHSQTLKVNLQGNRYLPVAWSTIEGKRLLWKQR